MVETVLEPLDHLSADSFPDAIKSTSEEGKQFKDRPVAKLIAAVSFLTGRGGVERTAISHLGAYILSVMAQNYAMAKLSDAKDISCLHMDMIMVSGGRRPLSREV